MVVVWYLNCSLSSESDQLRELQDTHRNEREKELIEEKKSFFVADVNYRFHAIKSYHTNLITFTSNF